MDNTLTHIETIRQKENCSLQAVSLFASRVQIIYFEATEDVCKKSMLLWRVVYNGGDWATH